MSRPAVLSPVARAEVNAAVAWIAQANPAAARRLRQVVGDAARTRPRAGRRVPGLVGDRYRVWSLTGFPYLLVYDPAPEPPQILRVLHTSRDLPRLLADLRD